MGVPAEISTSYVERQQPLDPHGVAALHPLNQRLFKEARMSRRGRELVCRALQFLPRP